MSRPPSTALSHRPAASRRWSRARSQDQGRGIDSLDNPAAVQNTVRRLTASLAAALALATTAAADPLDTAMGKALFARNWVPHRLPPMRRTGSVRCSNARSCNACHAGGGPARFETGSSGLKARGLVVRIGDPNGQPHPQLGAQLQTMALPGLGAEARVAVSLRTGN